MDRSRILSYLATVMATALLPSLLDAQPFLEQTKGPEGGATHIMATPTGSLLTIRAGTSEIFRSSDRGRSWRQTREHDGSSLGIVEYAFMPNGSIVAIRAGGGRPSDFLRSDDDGVTWREVGAGGDRGRITALLPTGNGAVVMIADSGVFRASDPEGDWVPIAPPAGRSIDAVRSSRGEIFRLQQVTEFAPNDTIIRSFVLRSRDEGSSWALFGDTLPPHYQVASQSAHGDPITVTANGDLYLPGHPLKVGTGPPWIFRFPFGGSAWENVSEGLPVGGRISRVVATSDGALYATSLDWGLYRSTDTAATWRAVAPDTLRSMQGGVVRLADGALLVAEQSSIYRSDDGARRWERSAYGMPRTQTAEIAVGRNGALFASVQNVLYRSTDDGETWRDLFPPLPSYTVISEIDVDPSGILYIGTRARFLTGTSIDSVVSRTAGLILRSTDDGASWQILSRGLTAGSIQSIGFVGGMIVAASDAGVYRSTNDGENWEATNVGLPALYIDALASTPDGLLFVTTASAAGPRSPGSGIWRSSDQGATWHDANTGLDDARFRYLDRNPATGTLYALPYNLRGVWRSTNNGDSWTKDTSGLPAAPTLNAWSIGFSPQGIAYLPVQTGGVSGVMARSTDDGRTWETIETTPLFYRIAFNSAGRLFAGSNGQGVWRSTGSTRVPTPVERHLLSMPELAATTADGRITLRYTSPSGGEVAITLFDALGRTVRTILRATESAGERRILFDTERLSGGAYYLQLKVGEIAVVQPIVIAR